MLQLQRSPLYGLGPPSVIDGRSTPLQPIFTLLQANDSPAIRLPRTAHSSLGYPVVIFPGGSFVSTPPLIVGVAVTRPVETIRRRRPHSSLGYPVVILGKPYVPIPPLTVTVALNRATETKRRRRPYSRLAAPPISAPPSLPVNTVAPVVSGTPLVGNTLSTTNGTWTFAPTSYTYQWQRDNHQGGTYSNIGGATSSTYILVDLDDLCKVRCQVTAHNASGTSIPAPSNALVVTEPPPVNTIAPLATGSPPQVGVQSNCTTGTWLHMGGYNNPPYTYQWQLSATGVGGWANIVGATSSGYTPVIGDLGQYIRCVVTAQNSNGATAYGAGLYGAGLYGGYGLSGAVSANSNVLGAVVAVAVCPTAASIAVGPVTVSAGITRLGLLGCGVYETVVLTRGGQELVAILPWTSLDWGRVLDDTSEASVTGSMGQDEECCAALALIKPWRHELAVYRDGVQVWVGPIIQIQTPPGNFSITARDLSAWWDHRLIHKSHNYLKTDLATIFEAFFEDAMAPDPSPGIILSTSLSGVKGSKRVLTAQHQMAGAALRDLANTGIDWTAVGRAVLGGGLAVPTQQIGTFIDAHFATPPTPTLTGDQQTNSPTVRGAGGGQSGDRIFATASEFAAIAQDGLLESVETVSTITDYQSAIQASGTTLALRKQVVQIENCRLSPEAPFPIDRLIPGALCHLDLRETCIPVVGSYRLKSITASIGDGNDDAVTLVFQPEGTLSSQEIRTGHSG